MALKVLADLRGRYFACKGPRSAKAIEQEVGVSYQILARFGRGGYISMESLEAIEAWILREEARNGATTPR
jgi:predicted site-specific integrase-resolvase